MEYKLAKELKDAGFPQRGNGKFLKGQLGSNAAGRDGFEVCYAPTLSELIRECGDRFHDLRRNSDGSFTARGAGETETRTCLQPDEAAVHLWLALNRKTLTAACAGDQ